MAGMAAQIKIRLKNRLHATYFIAKLIRQITMLHHFSWPLEAQDESPHPLGDFVLDLGDLGINFKKPPK